MSDTPTANDPFKNIQPQVQQQLNNLSKETGYDIPVEAVPLPSKGLLYSLDQPLAN